MVQRFVVEVEMVVATAGVCWTVYKSVLRAMVVEGVVTPGWMEAMGVDREVALNRSSAMVTLLQDLQHMRWNSGREQWRFSTCIRQKMERSP